VEDALLGLEDELAALDLRHAALLRAADEQAACGDGEPACTVRPARARARESADRAALGRRPDGGGPRAGRHVIVQRLVPAGLAGRAPGSGRSVLVGACMRKNQR